VDETDALGALEEWAEKWEREQWDRRNASAPSAERGAQAGDKRARKKNAGVSSSSAKSSRVDASGLAELLAASSRPSLGDKDHENRARGPCRSCISRADPAARCFSFASLSGWRARGAEALAPLARASPEDAAASAQAFGCVAVSAHAFARAAAASRVEAARDGALCARCGLLGGVARLAPGHVAHASPLLRGARRGGGGGERAAFARRDVRVARSGGARAR
jgi:hypothetical protein